MIAQDEVRSPTTFSAGTHLGIVEWGGRGLSGGYKKTVVAIARQPLFPFSTELDHDRGGGIFQDPNLIFSFQVEGANFHICGGGGGLT